MVASVNSNCARVEYVVVNSVLRDRLDVNVQGLGLSLGLWSRLVIGVCSRDDQYQYDQPDQYSPFEFPLARRILQFQDHLRSGGEPPFIRDVRRQGSTGLREWSLTNRKEYMRSRVGEERIARSGSNAEALQGSSSIQTRGTSTERGRAYLDVCQLRPPTINLPEHDPARGYEKVRPS
jgi:hypothetical protein